MYAKRIVDRVIGRHRLIRISQGGINHSIMDNNQGITLHLLKNTVWESVGSKKSVHVRTQSYEKSNKTASIDEVTLSQDSRDAQASTSILTELTVPVSSSSVTSPYSVQIRNIVRDSGNPSAARGDLDLSPYGLGIQKIEIQQNLAGQWTSNGSVEVYKVDFNGDRIAMDARITADGLEMNFRSDSSDETVQNAVSSLTSIFENDRASGVRSLGVLTQLQNQDRDAQLDFLTGFNVVSSQSADALGQNISNYFTLFNRQMSQSNQIAGRLQTIDSNEIGRFLDTSVQSNEEFGSLLYYMDLSKSVENYNFLDTAEQAQSKLETLLTQMNRFEDLKASEYAQVFTNLQENVGAFADQLERADDNQLDSLFTSSIKSGENVSTLIDQFKRMDDDQYDAYVDIASQAGDRVGALAAQTARFDDAELDTMIQLSTTALDTRSMSSFLYNMERVTDEDLPDFTRLLESSGDRFTSVLFQMSRLEKEDDRSTYIQVCLKLGGQLPEFLSQMKRTGDLDLHNLIYGFNRLDSGEDPAIFETLLGKMKGLKDEDLSPFLRSLNKPVTA